MKKIQTDIFDFLDNPNLLRDAENGRGGRAVRIQARKRREKTWQETDPMSFVEIAAALGTSRQMVEKIYRRAVEKIRRAVLANPKKYDILLQYLGMLEEKAS